MVKNATETANIPVKFEVTKIRHHNEETGYTVIEARFTEYKSSYLPTSEIIMVGSFLSIFEEDEFEGVGSWINHKIFGYQFKLNQQKRIIPQSKKGIKEFLKRSVKGIGEKTANSIIECFGEQTLSKIEENWKNLLEIKGIGKERAKKIHDELVKHKKYEEVAIFVLNNGLGYRVAMRIYEGIGDGAIHKIKDNPFCLCAIPKVGFRVADKFARNLLVPFDNHERVKEGILFFIDGCAKSRGDLYVSKEYLVENLTEFLTKSGAYYDMKKIPAITSQSIEKAIKELKESDKLSIEKNVEGETCIYLKKYAVIENRIITLLKKLIEEQQTPICTEAQIQEFIDEYEKSGFTFAENQKKAIFTSLRSGMSVLTGGPGTGKTQTINAIIKCIKHVKPYALINLCAPTGKASKRMTELTNMESQTIHRLIKLNGFEKDNETETIEGDFLIIDESSMIDAYVFYKMLEVIDENTRVIFVGDYNQLPSVGPGLILRDLIASERIPTTILNEIFRQAKESQIVMNSHKVINGIKTTDKDGITFDNSKDDFYFIKRNDRIQAQQTILESIDRFINNHGFKLQDIQVLSPMRKGDLGVANLNRLVQQKFNPPVNGKKELKVDEITVFRVGDKCIQTTNNYDIGVFNGEVGQITSIAIDSDGFCEVEIDFDDKSIKYDDLSIDELELAYVITIHKSQGSEFPIVIMPVHSSQESMLNRNLIYTAWTRAKQKVVCIGTIQALNKGIDTADNTARNSRIKERIMNEIKA